MNIKECKFYGCCSIPICPLDSTKGITRLPEEPYCPIYFGQNGNKRAKPISKVSNSNLAIIINCVHEPTEEMIRDAKEYRSTWK